MMPSSGYYQIMFLLLLIFVFKCQGSLRALNETLTHNKNLESHNSHEFTYTEKNNIGNANRKLRTCHSCQKKLDGGEVESVVADQDQKTSGFGPKKTSRRHAKDHERYRQKLAELRAIEASTGPNAAPVGDIRETRAPRASRSNRAPREPRPSRASRNSRAPRNKEPSLDDNHSKPGIPPPVEADVIRVGGGRTSKSKQASAVTPAATPAVTTKGPVESEAGAVVGHIGKDTSADSGLYDKSQASTTNRGQLARGKRAALFQVHFEGNLGDQMETIPLLQRLSEWGVQVDCYLSMWQDPNKRLNEVVKARVAKYVSNFYIEGIPQDHLLKQKNYDIVIITPGPTVNELTHCIGKVHMVWFGVSVTNWAVDTYLKHKNCLKLVAVREEVSFDKASRMLDPHFDDIRLMLSGDISYSYQAIESEVNTFKQKYQESLGAFLETPDWVLIFSRENNFGRDKGIYIEGNIAHIKTIEGNMLAIPCNKIVFASSSDLEDNEHMKILMTKHHFERNKLVTFHSVEEMWAMVSLAPQVVTDRYHPGIAALIIGTKLTLTNYPNEYVKMSGLNRMQQYGREEIRKMNEKAFDRLLQIIHKPKVVEHTVTSL